MRWRGVHTRIQGQGVTPPGHGRLKTMSEAWQNLLQLDSWAFEKRWNGPSPCQSRSRTVHKSTPSAHPPRLNTGLSTFPLPVPWQARWGRRAHPHRPAPVAFGPVLARRAAPNGRSGEPASGAPRLRTRARKTPWLHCRRGHLDVLSALSMLLLFCIGSSASGGTQSERGLRHCTGEPPR